MVPEPPSRRELLDQSFADSSNQPPILHLQYAARFSQMPKPHTLDEYRSRESPQARADRIYTLWLQLQALQERPILSDGSIPQLLLLEGTSINPERAEKLRKVYLEELYTECQSHAGPSRRHGIDLKTFQSYVDQKEEELWSIFHNDLDLDGNNHLDAEELHHALSKAGKSI
jgi:solute carrier family 25 (mitochondrial phosphate transporter), member 23/24/25/41